MGDRSTDPNWNPRMRNQGNPHAPIDTRPVPGVADGVLPPQGTSVPSPRFFGARYRLGAPIRPASIVFDDGFLGSFPPREPTVGDYASLARWQVQLSGAEALRPDLAEGCAAYRHFLYGGGAPFTFSYEAYVMNDESGRITLSNAMLDIQDGVEVVYESNPALTRFSLTGDAISVSDSSMEFPYPATENWQKAIGGHVIWLSGQAQVEDRGGETWFTLDMTLHAEDRYNFNPGQNDIVTGVPDSDNGTFEITGLAHQFTQTSELRRRLEWRHGTLGTGHTTRASLPPR